MKIYTKKGDKGDTSLASGKRVRKYDPRVELYGTTDELNSIIGVVLAFLEPNSSLHNFLRNIQNLLFELGSELAGFTPKNENGEEPPPIIQTKDIQDLEEQMDIWQENLPPIRYFILPGGTKAAAFLHQARTVCRRLERLMVKYKDEGMKIQENSLVFVNRLSDALFLSARVANQEGNIEEPGWKSRAKENNKM